METGLVDRAQMVLEAGQGSGAGVGSGWWEQVWMHLQFLVARYVQE